MYIARNNKPIIEEIGTAPFLSARSFKILVGVTMADELLFSSQFACRSRISTFFYVESATQSS